MKFFKWTFVTLSILLVCALIFRESLYRQFFTYKFIGHRTLYRVTDKKLTQYIDSSISSFKPTNVRDIIKFTLHLTSEKLIFKEAKNDNDPNKLIRTRNAHCIGYSAFFSATCNYLLDKFGYSENWSSEPLVGQIYFCGTSIHQFSKFPFFKDHDFNSVTNKTTGEQYFVDPTVNDYIGVTYVTSKREEEKVTRK